MISFINVATSIVVWMAQTFRSWISKWNKWIWIAPFISSNCTSQQGGRDRLDCIMLNVRDIFYLWRISNFLYLFLMLNYSVPGCSNFALFIWILETIKYMKSVNLEQNCEFTWVTNENFWNISKFKVVSID